MEREKRIYGLIGYPVRHSLSPAMHNAAFKFLLENKEIDYDAEYRLFEVRPEDLDSFLSSLPEQNIYGLNVTIPYKIKVREMLEKKFPYNRKAPLIQVHLHHVKISGAINTINRIDKNLEYRNTDVDGFLKSLEEDLKFNKENKKILLLGCGGAGRAVVAALSLIRSNELDVSKIYINDVDKEKFESLKKDMSRISDPYKRFADEKMQFIENKQIPNIIKDCDLLVNASPIGMKEADGSIIDKKLLHENLSIYDLVYNRETQLIKDAKALKLKYIDGLKMLWRQGILSFEIWTEKKAPEDVMWKALCS